MLHDADLELHKLDVQVGESSAVAVEEQGDLSTFLLPGTSKMSEANLSHRKNSANGT